MTTMTIDGIAYREQPEPRNLGPTETACDYCAFGGWCMPCSVAIDTSPAVFGGDCMQRKVVYVRALPGGDA